MTNLRSYMLMIVGILALFTTTRCGKDERMYPIGPGVKANLVVYFKVEVTDVQIDSFFHEALTSPNPEGHGYNHKGGVASILRLERVQDHKAIAITFFENATESQREEVRSSIQKSPIVFKVLENVVPAEVRSIE